MMKNMHFKGGLLELVGDLSDLEVTGEPVSGDKLKHLVAVLSAWATGPTFAADCFLSGLAQTETRDVILELSICAEENVAVLL